MSDDQKRQINGMLAYVFKGGLFIIGTFIALVFNDMRATQKELHEDVKAIVRTVIQLEEKVTGHKESIDELKRTKADKK